MTGHRPEQFVDSGMASQNAKHWIENMVVFLRDDERFGMTEGISGMALGVDTWWAVQLLKYEVPLSAYVPFWEQGRKWAESDRRTWGQIIGAARDVKVFGRSEPYDVNLFGQRNQGMVDDCDLLLAVADGSGTGGSHRTLAYAKASGCPWIHYNPWDNTVEGSDEVKEIFG